MKKLTFTFLFSFVSVLAFATDLFVKEFGGGGAYSNISDAIAAASSGDRILIVPKSGSAPYIENLTINKQLQFLSATNGSMFTVQGNITIGANLPTNSHIVFDGMQISIGNITIAGTSSTNPISVTIVNCSLNSGVVTLTKNINATIANSSISVPVGLTTSPAVQFSKGKFLGNVVSAEVVGISVIDDIASLDSTFIVGNRISLVNSTGNTGQKGIYWNNNTQFFYISNNFVNSTLVSYLGTITVYALIDIYKAKDGNNASESNNILNNTLRYAASPSSNSNISFIGISSSSSLSSYTNIFNNLIQFPYGTSSARCNALRVSGSPQVSYNILNCATQFNSTYNNVPAPIGPGNATIPGIVSLTSNGCPVSTLVNAGHPDPVFSDLDLTRNDIGPCGGSYNITTNFHTNGPAGSARVHWLQAPRRVLQGATLDIQAEGHDR